MADDPYNFEIDIPAAASGGASYGRGRYDDSEEGESSGGSSEAMSDLDDEDEDEESLEQPRKIKPAASKPVARAAPAVATRGGGDALDKAKSFLSKYTAKPVETKASSASSRRRVELSLDEEDFSADFSPEASRRRESDDESEYQDSEASPVKKQDWKKGTGTAAAPPVVARAAAIADEPPEQSYREESRDDESRVAQSDEFEDESEEPPPPYIAVSTVAATAKPVTTNPVSNYALTTQWKPSVAILQPDPDEEQSVQDESVESESEIIESQDHSTQEKPASRLIAPSYLTREPVVEQSAPSESGVYEEDAFEDDSIAPSPDTRPIAPTVLQPTLTHQAVTKSEPVFDYSMDFSDDGIENGGKRERIVATSLAPTANDTYGQLIDASAERESDGEQSALLESDENSQMHGDPDKSPKTKDVQPSIFHEGVNSQPSRQEQSSEEVYSTQFDSNAENYTSKTLGEDDHATATLIDFLPVQDAVPSSKPVALQHRDTDAGVQRDTTVIPGMVPQPSSRENELTVQSSSIKSRSRVTIVRDYVVASGEKPEMRDASTQFTGNHAGIQTDLVPDGMHNLREATRVGINTVDDKTSIGVSGPSSSPNQNPPTPPPAPVSTPIDTSSPQLSSFYNMNLLQQPIATSTSLYKQQLLALQEQILQKKRETERLVSERMSFQYGSSRGTERFTAARRPPRLQLWEALMRVDPTLDEKKAKEAARLTQVGYVD